MNKDDFIIELLAPEPFFKEGKTRVTHKETGISWTGWYVSQLMKSCHFDAEIHMLNKRIDSEIDILRERIERLESNNDRRTKEDNRATQDSYCTAIAPLRTDAQEIND